MVVPDAKNDKSGFEINASFHPFASERIKGHSFDLHLSSFLLVLLLLVLTSRGRTAL